MRQRSNWVFLIILFGGLCHSTSPSPAQQIGFVEDFALADDRLRALAELIPGTEEHYYYYSLHYQNTGQLAKVDELLPDWHSVHGSSAWYQEIESRQMLLNYERDQAKALEAIRRRLNLQFNHERQVINNQPDLATVLNQDLINRETYTRLAMARSNNTDGFSSHALEWLAGEELTPQRRRHLLQRLQRPDYANLVDLVLEDLKTRDSRGFGSIAIHTMMTKSQLDECLTRRPALRTEANFVNIYISKLMPSADEDWRSSDDTYLAYLESLWSFVKDLPPVFNSMKTHVLYHRLAYDRAHGVYDADRFLTYARLPRQTSYIHPEYLRQIESRQHVADLNANYQNLTQLPPIGNDEPLVGDYLQHFFLTAENYQNYARLIRESYLKLQFAETKIVNGIGDQDRWYALLTPSQLQELRERVEIEFAHTNPESFSAEDSIFLDLFVKNVDNLIIKVFEINTVNFYRQNQSEISTTINLDGLVANIERNENLDQPEVRRTKRRFEFPELKNPGVYVIDFIGNGRSSRVIVRKGKLRHVIERTIAGHEFTIFDENRNQINDAMIWLSGREYKADEDGTITIPYSTQPGNRPIVITHDGFSTLDYFRHEAESYSLNAGFYVDRESLIARTKAQLQIRAGLLLNGEPVSLSLLDDVKLSIVSVDHEGISTSTEVPNFELSEAEESLYEFQVPSRMASIRFDLTATVRNVSRNADTTLSASQGYSVNSIDREPITEDLHLSYNNGGFVLELLGKTGESKKGRPISLAFTHRDFTFTNNMVLQTNEGGAILLGEMKDIVSFNATAVGGRTHNFVLPNHEYLYYQTLHTVAGDDLHVPYIGAQQEVTRQEFGLLEIRGTTFVADHFERLSLQDGMLHVSSLPAGDYWLYLKGTDKTIQIRATDGTSNGNLILGDYRQLETRLKTPFHIRSAEVRDDKLVIQTANSGAMSRIHLYGTAFVPSFSAFAEFGRVADANPFAMQVPRAKSLYVSGRQIGDEYQYILDRRYARIYPGNMLERPSMLLNPWAVRETATDRQDAEAGNQFSPESDSAVSGSQQGLQNKSENNARQDFSNLDFLATPTGVMFNLHPDEDGRIEIPLDVMSEFSSIRVVGVDPRGVCSRLVPLPVSPRIQRDLRLAEGLDPTQHFTQQKQTTLLKPGEELVVTDVTTSQFQTYRSFGDVYRLYLTMSSNSTLAEFGFILRWHEMESEEKRELYSKYSCHELNFFLLHKDPDFFYDVVQPYVINKKDKTFLDHWLIDDDLSPYLDPWRHARMNVVEQVLLGRRLNGELPNTERFIEDLYDLSPTSRDRYTQLFRFAVKGNALSTDDALGLMIEEKALAQSQDRLYADDMARGGRGRIDASDGAVAPRFSGGFGGGGGGRPGAGGGEFMDESGNRQQWGQANSRSRRGLANEIRSSLDRESIADFQSGLAEEESLQRRLGRRSEIQQLYRQVDTTKEWAENNYYQLPNINQNSSLVDVNRFWRDYVHNPPNEPFFSIHFPEADGSFTEMMMALAVLDLPMVAPELEADFDDREMTVSTTSPVFAFHEEIRPAIVGDGNTSILVSQNFFRHGDRYKQVGNEQVDKFVTDEFLTHVAYGCQVVLTNPTSSRQKVDVLTQIPEGSIPVYGNKNTNTKSIDLQPYHTESVEFYFYFPGSGEYAHYPVHVSREDQLVAFAESMTFNVVDELSNIDRESWAYVSQFGSNGDVIEFLNTHNLRRLDLTKIAFRMKDEEFFNNTLDLIRNRHAYENVLWSYAIKHNHVDAIREYLQYANRLTNSCGPALNCSLLTIDPVVRKTYEHLEYRPLINARAHQLGPDRRILNDRFYQQYQRLLNVLAHQRNLDDESMMAVTYYMLLQDRIEEAIKFFERVNPDRLPSRIQYDYFSAYLDLYLERPERAKQTAERYARFEVDRWREMFAAVVAQVNEIEGAANVVIDEDNRDQEQAKLADQSPSLEFEVESNQIKLNYRNINTVRVNYYVMDIELLFSRNPFVQQFSGQFSYIRPNQSAEIELDANEQTTTIELPESLRASNVLVEVTGGGLAERKAYYSNSLDVQLQENYGYLSVRHEETRRPISKTYIKVYARMNDGSVRFYKDGYTDLRGRFEYGSLSTNELDFVNRFAILVYSDEHGAVVREATPPQR